MNITRGIKKTAVRGVLYGFEGIGKTSFAAALPDPLFLDLEEGTSQLDVARVGIATANDLRYSIAELIKDAQGFKSVVIDSADWAERVVADALLAENRKKSIEDFGFGKGFTMLAEEFAKLLGSLDLLISKGINVWFIAHAKTVRVSPPDMVDGYDRYELKLGKHTAPILKEWADVLLFANYETQIVKGNDGKLKGDGGKRRLIHCERSAAWDAKNRYGLPETVEMPKGKLPTEIAAIFTASPAAKPAQAKPAQANPTEAPFECLTDDQQTDLAGYYETEIGKSTIEKALEHFNCLTIGDFSKDQAQKVIDKIKSRIQ